MKVRKKPQYIRDIYYAWNQTGIMKNGHRKLTDKMKRTISGALNDYTVDEIIGAINNYATVLLGDEYFWTYRWTLREFIGRGLEKFIEEDSVENHRKVRREEKTNNPPVISSSPSSSQQANQDMMREWVGASPEKRAELEAKWQEEIRSKSHG